MTLNDASGGLAHPEAKTPASWLRRYGSSLVVAFSFVYFARRMFRLISRYAVNIFFSDQWKFNDATLFEKHSLWQIFTWQHGWHRQGVGGLFSALVDPMIHWNSRTQAFVMGAIVLVTCLCALWLKRRLYGSFSVFDAMLPALFFTPAQYETLLITPNYSQGAFPLLLLMLFCLAWTCTRNPVRYPLILGINFLAMYTGFGMFLGLLTPPLLVFDYWATPAEGRPSPRYFGASVALAVASIAAFFAGYSVKLLNAYLCPTQPASAISSYTNYVAIMYADPFGIGGTGPAVKIAGFLVAIAVLGVFAGCLGKFAGSARKNLDPGSRRRNGVLITLIALSLVLCVNAAHGRLCLGLWSATASRYVICVLPGFLGLYFGLLEIRRAVTRRILSAGLAVVVIAAASHVSVVISYFPNAKRHWRDCYLQTEDAAKCDQVVDFPYTQTPRGIDIPAKLRYLKQTRENLYADSK
jgi:hypothetical protein